MRRIVTGIILSTALGAVGCATSGHRDSMGGLANRQPSWSTKTTAPVQTRESLPPEQPDLFMPTADATNHRRLGHFFPGLGRNTSPHPVDTARVATPATARPEPAPLELVAHANSGRPSLFGGSRKNRVPQTYMTDVRSSGAKSAATPAFLPVALQIPPLRQSDRSVTPTSADLPDEAEDSQSNPPDDRYSVSANPDSSDAKASPSSTTEPQLAIDPREVSDAVVSPPPVIEPTAEPANESLSTSPPPADAPEPAAEPAPTRDEPARDPRERPRLSDQPTIPAESTKPVEPAATSTDPAPTAQPTEPEPAATVAKRPAQADVATDARRVAQARPSVADPGNSLGLPPVTLPATYGWSTPQGSSQANQPSPVLASPQVAPTPQTAKIRSSSAESTGTMTRTWRVPSVRRLVRRIGGLGEFASPPTAAAH